MTWKYSGNPADSALDEVRFLVGDTDAGDQLLSDQEIEYLLVNNPATAGISNWSCASEAARAISSKMTKLISKTVGSLSLQYGQRAQQFADLAEQLDKKAVSGNQQVVGQPILGGGGTKYLSGTDWFRDSPL